MTSFAPGTHNPATSMVNADLGALALALFYSGNSDKQIAAHLNSARSAGESHLSDQEARDLYQAKFRELRIKDERRRA